MRAFVTGSSAFQVMRDDTRVEAGSTGVIEVGFAPSGEGDATGTLVLETDDPAHPRLEVPLRGRGVGVTFPLELASAVPNPFTGEALIAFTLPTRGHASLEVFDLLGRKVRVIASGELDAGPHAVRWDGSDGVGRKLPAGVYVVRLAASGAVLTRRVVRMTQ